MGYKLWTSGELLTSTDVNTYLMKQAVISTTSGSKPSSPTDGMLVFETDTERYVMWNATSGSWRILGQTITGTYTPTLTAATTNPTLGTGGGQNARFTLWGGNWCTFRGTIAFGTSGTNAGSGQYFIALPFQVNSNITGGVATNGSGVIRCAGTLYPIVWYAAVNATTFSGLTPSGNVVASGQPGAWTANDYISFTMTYETV